MIRRITVSLLLLLAPVLQSPELVQAQAQEGQPFPAFELPSSQGSVVSSDQFDGEVRLINFWATWCPPCRVEIPWFIEFKRQYEDLGFEVVGVTLDGENSEGIARFIRDLEINYPIVLSNEKILKEIGGIIGVPTTFILDRRGWVAMKHVGLASREQLLAKIEELLEEK